MKSHFYFTRYYLFIIRSEALIQIISQAICIESFMNNNVNANSKKNWPNCGMHDEAVCSGDVSCQNLLLHVLSNVN